MSAAPTLHIDGDLEYLRAAYAAAGVSEYWIIDARRSELRFEILQLVDGEYRPAPPTGSNAGEPSLRA